MKKIIDLYIKRLGLGRWAIASLSSVNALLAAIVFLRNATVSIFPLGAKDASHYKVYQAYMPFLSFLNKGVFCPFS